MVSPALDANGLRVLSLPQIRQNLRDGIAGHPRLGPKVSTGPETRVGELIDVFAARLAEPYELLQEIHDSRSPGAAEGVQLDNVSGLVAVVRQPATPSRVLLRLFGTPGTPIAAGSRAKVLNGPLFAIDMPAVIGAGGSVDVPATCTVTGPISASAGGIDQIVDKVPGWDSVTNPTAAIEGTHVEKDSQLRVRRERSLSAGGTARDAAIRARLEALDEVTAAAVISNRTLVTDARGIPGKAFRSVVWPPNLNGQRIAEAIWSVAPSGIYIDGDQVFSITDDRGYEQMVRFTYGHEREVHVRIAYVPNPQFPGSGHADIAQACRDFDDGLSLGSPVLPWDLGDFIRDRVPGIDHLIIHLRFDANPIVGTHNLPLFPEVDEVARIDSHITVLAA